MAEQIRSFWSHLCGIFGAIFAMFASGTLVSIDRAEAFAGCESPRYGLLSNGAYVQYCYQSVSHGMCERLYTSGSGNYYGLYDRDRYYVYFLGCLDGYYLANATIRNITSNAIITPTITPVTSGPQSQGGMFNCGQWTMTPGGSKKCTHCNSLIHINGYSIEWDATPEEQTDGFCLPCPAYDDLYNDYTAKTIPNGASTSSARVYQAGCFMSKEMPRYDSIEHNGDATGQFVWTSDCAYESMATSCLSLSNNSGFDSCSMQLEDAGGDKLKAYQYMSEISGMSMKTAKEKVEGTLPVTFVKKFNCSAANCYMEAMNAEGMTVTVTYE